MEILIGLRKASEVGSRESIRYLRLDEDVIDPNQLKHIRFKLLARGTLSCTMRHISIKFAL